MVPDSPTPILALQCARWDEPLAPATADQALATVERGGVLFFPQLPFVFAPEERRFLSERWSDGRAKNISFDRRRGSVAGARGDPGDLAALATLIGRFAASAQTLCATLFASYRPPPSVMRTSFRPVPAQARETSWRKDDRLLHIDAFPSRPNRGERILRVFTNVNPDGEARVWRVGEPFEDVARRFLPRIPAPWPGSGRVLAALHVTKGVRSPYDHIMLHLHDRMKADAAYQREAPQAEVAFPGGSTWVCFSDQVSHAVMHGQYMMEQTLQVPVAAMRDPTQAPVAVLERLAGRALV